MRHGKYDEDYSCSGHTHIYLRTFRNLGLGLMTEIKDPWQLLLSDVNESLLHQIVNISN